MAFRKNGQSSSYSKVSLDDFSDDDSDEGDFVQSNIRRNQELMKKQDEGLDVLATSVARLGELSMGISDELGQQNKMLESMETDLETSAEELDIVTRKTKEFIKRAGGEKNCLLITSLSVVALILFFLVLYT